MLQFLQIVTGKLSNGGPLFGNVCDEILISAAKLSKKRKK